MTGLLLIMSGGTNSLSGNYKEAFENYKEAEKYVGKEHNGDITLSLGILYSYMQEHDIAHNYYQKAVEDTTLTGNNRLSAIVNYLVNFVEIKNYDGALNNFEKYKTDLIPIEGTIEEYKLWSILSEAYEAKGDWKRALDYRNKSIILKDSIHSENLRSQMDSIISEIDVLALQDEKRSVHNKNWSKNPVYWILSGIISILLVLSCRLLWRYRKTRRESEEVSEKLRSTLKEVERIEETRNEMEHTSQELSVCKARLSHISESMAELRRLAANPKTHKSELVNTVESTTRSFSADSQVWEQLRVYTEGASQSFFDKLYRLHPELTNSETRMCAFILLGRTTKEIAAILNRSPRTVESIKYSLRVKLRIKDITTEQYLRKISATSLDELLGK